MTKSRFGIAAGVILLISWAGGHAPGLLIAGTGICAAYHVSLYLHPRTRHTGLRSCKGTGERKGTIFGWGHRKCPRCNGGRLIRWGAGNFGTGHIKAEYRRGKDARARARAGHRWR